MKAIAQKFRDDKQRGNLTAFTAKSETPGTPLGVYNPNFTNPEDGTVVFEYSSGHYSDVDVGTILSLSDVVIINYGVIGDQFFSRHIGVVIRVSHRASFRPSASRRAGLHYSSQPKERYAGDMTRLMAQLEARDAQNVMIIYPH